MAAGGREYGSAASCQEVLDFDMIMTDVIWFFLGEVLNRFKTCQGWTLIRPNVSHPTHNHATTSS